MIVPPPRLILISALCLLTTACSRAPIDSPGSTSRGELPSISDRQSSESIPASPQTAEYGQTIYVPVYSHISVGDRGLPFGLAITLTFRNTDAERQVTVLSARYFDDKGRLIKDFAARAQPVGPMGALEFFVEESDVKGGTAASFLVEWISETPVSEPMVEAVMIGTRNQQGVSFTSHGRVLKARSPRPVPEPDVPKKP
jgi:hypothetical protein